MSALLVATAAAALISPTCSWDQPGHNPYTGTPEAALDHYKDIPAAQRTRLARKIAAGRADDEVSISRNGISGKKRQYYPEIKDMHFGANQVCRSTTRWKWKIEHREPGAVYCEGDHCLLVPKVCGNISRITRRPEGGAGPLLGPLYPARGRLLPAPPPSTPIYDVSGPSGGEDEDLPPPAAAPYFPIADSYGAPFRSAYAPAFVPYAPFGLVPFPTPGLPSPGRETPVPTSPIPEPSTWHQICGGLAAFLLINAKKTKFALLRHRKWQAKTQTALAQPGYDIKYRSKPTLTFATAWTNPTTQHCISLHPTYPRRHKKPSTMHS